MSALFVYGTLLVPEILSIVLGRTVTTDDLTPATAHNHRRYALPDRSYPVMRACAGNETHGAVIDNVRDDELRRLDFFEADFYERRSLDVTSADGTMSAFAYVDPGTDPIKTIDWDLNAFTTKHLAAYLQETRAWMETYQR